MGDCVTAVLPAGGAVAALEAAVLPVAAVDGFDAAVAGRDVLEVVRDVEEPVAGLEIN